MPIKYTHETAKKKIYDTIVVTDGGCWEWQGARNDKGYGSLVAFGQDRAHRVSYILHHGPLLGSRMCVLHRCDNPPCVNPEHLFVGSHDENMKDMAKKKRAKSGYKGVTHCKRNHEFSFENTLNVPGGRKCRTCIKIHSIRLNEKRRMKK